MYFMCTQRLFLLIFVSFFIHLLSIIPIQCKRHPRSLDQHYIYHQNRTFPLQTKKSEELEFEKIDLSKLKIDSTSDWYPTFKVKLNSNFTNESNINESEKKSLLNLDGPNVLEDLESATDEDNSVHIRVKRDNPNKNNVVPRFKSNYLEDLAASFPKSEHELVEERLVSNEDEKLRKRSSGQENYNIENVNFKRRNKFDSSKKTSPNFGYKENLRYQQENLDSDLEDKSLKYRNKRNNYAKVNPESYSMKDEVARSVSQIANDYEKKDLGEKASYEYANDNPDDLQIPYSEDNKLIDSVLSKMDYVVQNGDYLDQENDPNDASTRQQSPYNNNLYSSQVLKPEQQNEAKFKSNQKSEEGEFVNAEEIKVNDVSLEDASVRFPGKEIRLNAALRDERRVRPYKKHNKRKFKKTKSKRRKKLKKKGRKNRTSNKLSKMRESLAHLDKVVGDIPVESKVEKRDSSDGRSEVDIAKRDISKIVKLENSEHLKPSSKVSIVQKLADRSKRDAQKCKKHLVSAKDVNKSLSKIQNSEELKGRFTRNENKDEQCIQGTDHENQELKYYENVHEPETLNRNDGSKSKMDRERRALTEDAMKSVEEIKILVEKLVTKVNNLKNIVGSSVNKRGKKETERKTKSNLKPTKNSKRCMALEKDRNATSKVTTKCNLEKPQLLQNSKDQEQKLRQFTKIKEKTNSNNLVQSKSDKIPGEIGERKRVRRKRKPHRKWDRWTDWSSCSVTCGKGRQIRWRHCIRDCRVAETEMEEKTCQLPACPPGKFLGIF